MTDPLAGGIIDDHRDLGGPEAEVRAQRWLDEERRVLGLIVRGEPLDKCLEELCLGAQKVQPGVRVCVLQASAERARFSRVVAPGLPLLAELMRGADLTDSMGTCARAVLTGVPCACANLGADDRWHPEWRSLCLAQGVQATYSSPINTTGEQCAGSVCLCFDAPTAPTTWDVRFAAALACVAEITLRHGETRALLAESEHRVRQIVGSLPVAIYATDAQGRITLHNDAAATLWGRRPLAGDLWCGSWRVYLPDGTPVPLERSPMAAAIRGERTLIGAELVIERPDGVRRHVLPFPHPLRAADGSLIGAVNMMVDVTDRKQIELALRTSEARYRRIVESQADLVCRFRPDGTILFANDAYARARGTFPEALVGVDFWHFIPEHDRAAVRALLDTITPENPEIRIENRFQTEGGVRWTLWTNRGLEFDERGHPTEIQSSGVDITDRKRAEEERELLLERERAARDEAETLNEVLRSLLGQLDVDRVVSTVTAAGVKLSGAGFGFFVDAGSDGTPRALSGVAPADLGPVRRHFAREFAQVLGERRAVRAADPAEGVAAPVGSLLGVPIVSGSGTALGGLFFLHAEKGVFTERAERLAVGVAALAALAIDNARLYESVRQNWSRVREMAHTAPAMLWVTERDGSCSFQSHGWCEYTGQSEQEALGFGWLQAVHPDDRARSGQIFRAASKKREPFSLDYRIRRADGEYRWAIDSGRPRFSPTGEFMGFIGSVIDVHERKQAESALRESEERLRLAADATGFGAYDFDLRSRRTVWSPQLRRILGVPENAEGSESVLAELVHPDDREKLAHDVTSACSPSNTTRHEFEFRIIRPDGEVRWLHDTGQVLFDGDGEARRPIRIIGAVQDVTERKRSEQRLAVARAVTHVLATAGSIGEAAPKVLRAIASELGFEICNLWLPDHDSLRCNHTYASSGEASIQSFLERTRTLALEQGRGLPGKAWAARDALWVEDLSRETTLPRAADATQAGLVSGVAVPVLSADRFLGVIEFFSRRRAPFDPPLLGKLSALGSDFGQFLLRTQAEESLRDSEERFRTLADNMSQFAWMTDAKGWISWYNKRWYDYTGTSFDQVKGWGWMRVHHPDHVQRVVEKFQNAMETGKDWEDVFPLRGKDGAYRWFLSRAHPIRDGSGRIVRWFGTNTDITERREMEEMLARHKSELELRVEERTKELTTTYERLRMSERMAMMGTLSAGLGHDLGNLLVPIRVRLESLSHEPLSTQAKDDLEAIRTSAEYLRRLAHGLRLLALDPQRTIPGESTILAPWWADAEGILRSVLPRGVTLEAEVPAPDLVVRISRAALTQVVFNLVQNAGDAMKERGSGKVRFRAWAEDSAACLRVEDNGPGMTPEVRDRCMEPFFTTKSRAMSTGLGLMLVYGLVREAGGSIELRSEPGEGTSFTLKLPTAPHAVPLAQGSDPAGRVAIVDVRDPRIKSFVSGELRSLRFTVEGAAPGATLAVLDDATKLAHVPPGAVVVLLNEAPEHPPERSAGIRALGAAPGIAAIREAIRASITPNPTP